MKKKTYNGKQAKLQLHRETLTNLTTQALGRVAGGSNSRGQRLYYRLERVQVPGASHSIHFAVRL